MQALVWQGKNKVEMVTVPRPVVVEDRDVILEVTGSTVCGSDLHLLHGSVIEMEKGDILGHEFCGRVKEKGSRVTNLNVGDRVVASFQIGCGECMYCKKKLSSQCEKTNSNSIEYAMYGGHTAGMFGYSHFTGGFAGGQAEYVRVPNGDVNLLKIPNDVPDEKGESSRHVANMFDESNHNLQHSTFPMFLPLLTTALLTLVSRRVT
jgi:threonine dehydrogenase-like Zn-dependent dehydrogenase